MALENLTVDMVVDPEGIRRGFAEALQMVNGFTREAREMVSRADLVSGGLEAGEQAAASMVRGLRTQFEQSQAQNKEMFFRGLSTPGQFEAIGKANAAEFNAGMLRGINQLAASGMLTKNLRTALVGELKEAGLEAGEALRAQIANKLVEVGGHLQTAGGHAEAFGEKGVRASQRFAFGLQAIAEGGARAEHGMKGVLESVSEFAGMFGTTGIVVASLAAGALAIYNYFNKAREEMKKTREAFEQEVGKLLDAGDSIALINKYQDILQGKPSAGIGSEGFFAGSVQELRAEQHKAESDMQRALNERNVFLYNTAKKANADLKRQLEPLEAELTDLDAMINNPALRPNRRTVGISSEVHASTNERAGKDAESAAAKALRAQEKAARDFANGLKAVAEAAKLSGTGSDFIEGINERLITSYDAVTDAINRQKDAFSPYATELRKIREEMEKSPIIKMLKGDLSGLPPVRIASPGTPEVGALRGPRASEVPAAPIFGEMSRASFALHSFTNALTTTGRSIRDDFHKTVGAALSIFTPTGAAMAVFGGIVEGMTPLLEALKEPLRVVGEILGKALAPILKSLFPIFKGVAIAATYIGEIFLKVSSGISIGIGSLLRGIGNLLNKLPGSIGNPLKRLGQEMIDFGNGQREAADALRKGRDELRNLEWNDALNNVTNAANSAAEALRNVPIGWNAALAAFEAGRTPGGEQPAGAPTPPPSNPSDPTGFPVPGGGGTGGGGGAGGGTPPVAQTTIIVESVRIGDNLTPKEQAKFFVGALQDIASDQFGNSSRWPEVRV